MKKFRSFDEALLSSLWLNNKSRWERVCEWLQKIYNDYWLLWQIMILGAMAIGFIALMALSLLDLDPLLDSIDPQKYYNFPIREG